MKLQEYRYKTGTGYIVELTGEEALKFILECLRQCGPRKTASLIDRAGFRLFLWDEEWMKIEEIMKRK